LIIEAVAYGANEGGRGKFTGLGASESGADHYIKKPSFSEKLGF
jgi:hypothetical protein